MLDLWEWCVQGIRSCCVPKPKSQAATDVLLERVAQIMPSFRHPGMYYLLGYEGDMGGEMVKRLNGRARYFKTRASARRARSRWINRETS